ncbi:glycine-rich cell wall structural protein-like [Hyposmocoma kahamanoa]|uniref:glycine-rich cell wall structural protein-like n=1 Tax=Hyposmocoma kahamanoa TaxID=1477025 RepID=UPI000E6D9C8A|nr:glycine-rich cell wall structural protein-like [Hyposmocoma kahamanoa]
MATQTHSELVGPQSLLKIAGTLHDPYLFDTNLIALNSSGRRAVAERNQVGRRGGGGGGGSGGGGGGGGGGVGGGGGSGGGGGHGGGGGGYGGGHGGRGGYSGGHGVGGGGYDSVDDSEDESGNQEKKLGIRKSKGVS